MQKKRERKEFFLKSTREEQSAESELRSKLSSHQGFFSFSLQSKETNKKDRRGFLGKERVGAWKWGKQTSKILLRDTGWTLTFIQIEHTCSSWTEEQLVNSSYKLNDKIHCLQFLNNTMKPGATTYPPEKCLSEYRQPVLQRLLSEVQEKNHASTTP